MAGSANRKKNRCGFDIGDDSEEEGNRGPTPLKKPASPRREEPDFFDGSVEDMITESRNGIGASVMTVIPSQHGNNDLDGLFVADDVTQETSRRHYMHLKDLNKIKWHRVVLDEAQQIKNHETQSLHSCLHIDANCLWALSGTLLRNRNYELYPYLKFIGCEVGSFKEFLINFRKVSKAEANLDHLISAVAYRRMVEECFRRKMMPHMAAPGAGPSRKICLEMLLRLRKAATHPFLLESMMREYMTLDDIRKVRKRLADLREGPSMYDQIGSWTKRHEMSGERLQKVMISVSEEGEQRRFDQSSTIETERAYNAAPHESGGTYDFYNSVSEDENEISTEGGFSSDLDEVDSQDDLDDLSNQDFLELDAEDHAAVMEDSDPSQTLIPGDAPLEPFGQSNFGLHFDMDRHMDYLEKVELMDLAVCPVCKETPTVPVKGNCEHSFCNQCALDHLTTAILGRMLEAENIPFVYLTDKQTKDQRVHAVKGFQENEDIKVLVASMRAGGQALNLTRANRVIFMELWWNHAQEQQACARVFRYGQIKETHFARFIVQTPIEDRILRMQADKIVEIDRALQDDGHVIKGLSMHEIAQLLGRYRVKDSRAVIEHDYEEYEDDFDDIISNPDD
ncbi:SNF2 super family protein [Colletotrichum salicis]|uniref:SNF2 super family protein n=1 Tax=Colletotrichum salicis TaxID=1209931 RepID=A0A135UVG0_9PEZI|nr:SNF2 super family protein [Colletotrichum salicis]